MKNIAILKNPWSGNNDLNYKNNLKNLSPNNSNFIIVDYTKDIEIKISNDDIDIKLSGKSLDYFDVLFFLVIKNNKDIVRSIAELVSKRYQNIKLVSSVDLLGPPSGKLSQAMISCLQNVFIPKTISISGKSILSNYDFIESELKLPFIMKDSNSSRGRHNYLISSRQELESILVNYNSVDRFPTFIFQEFIKNEFDFRFLVLGKKVKVIIKRQRADKLADHRNNISVGGTEIFLDVNSFNNEVIVEVERIAKIFNSDVAGIDLILTKENKYVFLEINKSPGITYDPATSPELKIMSEYLSMI